MFSLRYYIRWSSTTPMQARRGIGIGTTPEFPTTERLRCSHGLGFSGREKIAFCGTGRRKAAVAHALVRSGAGGEGANGHTGGDMLALTINGMEPCEYFRRDAWLSEAVAPFVWVGASQLHVDCIVRGGGLGGQAGAIRLAVSRALSNLDHRIYSRLRASGCLTRNRRVVERKKTGKKKARKKFQWVKR